MIPKMGVAFHFDQMRSNQRLSSRILIIRYLPIMKGRYPDHVQERSLIVLPCNQPKQLKIELDSVWSTTETVEDRMVHLAYAYGRLIMSYAKYRTEFGEKALYSLCTNTVTVHAGGIQLIYRLCSLGNFLNLTYSNKYILNQ